MILISDLEGKTKFIMEETEIGVLIRTETLKIVSIKDTLEQAVKYVAVRLN